MTKFKIIFKQVFFKNIKSPAYIIMIIMPIILLGVVLGIGKLMDQSTEPAKIAVLSQQPAEQAALQQMRGQDYVIDTQIKTQPQAAQALKQEKIDGYLIIQQGNSQYFERKDSRDFDPSGIQNQLNEMNIVTLARQANVPADQIQKLTTPMTIKAVTVQFEAGQQKIDQSNQKQVGEGISLAITVLMFVFIVNYAGIIAQEIATEKGSRIMEIILSSVSATTQFFAKIAAVLALVLTQIVFYILIGVVGYHYLKQQLPLSAILKQVGPNLWTPPVWYAISFLIVGVLLYTVIAAMLGSVVSRMDQVQQAISPLLILSTISYMCGFILTTRSDIGFLKGLSYVPLFSQIMLPVRFASGDLTATAATLGLGLAIITLIGLTYLALIIYRMNILVYSDKGVMRSFMRSFAMLKAERQK